jgi:hypothetical protein
MAKMHIEIGTNGAIMTVSDMRRKLASALRPIPGSTILAFSFWLTIPGFASDNIEISEHSGHINATELRKLMAQTVHALYGANTAQFGFHASYERNSGGHSGI